MAHFDPNLLDLQIHGLPVRASRPRSLQSESYKSPLAVHFRSVIGVDTVGNLVDLLKGWIGDGEKKRSRSVPGLFELLRKTVSFSNGRPHLKEVLIQKDIGPWTYERLPPLGGVLDRLADGKRWFSFYSFDFLLSNIFCLRPPHFYPLH